MEREATARVRRGLQALLLPLGLDRTRSREHALSLEAVATGWTVAVLSYRRTGDFEEAAEVLAASIVNSGGGQWAGLMKPVFDHLEDHVVLAPWPIREARFLGDTLTVTIDFIDAEAVREADGLIELIQSGGDVSRIIDAVITGLEAELRKPAPDALVRTPRTE